MQKQLKQPDDAKVYAGYLNNNIHLFSFDEHVIPAVPSPSSSIIIIKRGTNRDLPCSHIAHYLSKGVCTVCFSARMRASILPTREPFFTSKNCSIEDKIALVEE